MPEQRQPLSRRPCRVVAIAAWEDRGRESNPPARRRALSPLLPLREGQPPQPPPWHACAFWRFRWGRQEQSLRSRWLHPASEAGFACEFSFRGPELPPEPYPEPPQPLCVCVFWVLARG